MRAVVYTGAGVEYTESRPLPEIGDRDLLVQMVAAGICATDRRIATGRYYQRELVPDGVVLGHEGVGRVVDAGRGVTDADLVGRHVVLDTVQPCFTCRYCRLDRSNSCVRWQHIGITRDGTFADFIAVPRSAVHCVLDTCDPAIAALAEPVGIAAHTFERLPSCFNRRCLVIGPGPLGLVHVALLRAAGAREIVVAGRSGDEERLTIARRLGAHDTVVAGAGSAEDFAAMADGIGGFEVVIEAAGTGEAVEGALALADHYGHVALLGLAEACTLRPAGIIRKNLTITGRRGLLSRHMEAAVALLQSSAVPWELLVTHRYPLARIDEAFGVVDGCLGVKVLLYT